MTKNASPDLLDLAEAVAAGELRAADAERQIEAAQVPELRGLIVAMTAVRSHARATREAAVAEDTERAASGAQISTMVPGAVGGATVRRHSSHNGDARAPRRTWLLLAATIAVGAGLIGLSVVGGGLIAPKPVPTATDSVQNPTAVPSSAPSATAVVAQPTPGALIAFIRNVEKPRANAENPGLAQCGDTLDATCPIPRVWVVGADGSGAHELMPAGAASQALVGWSPDGSQLLYEQDGGLYLTDASGSEPQRVDTGCVEPCRSDASAAFSNDGAHLLFLRTSADADGYDGRAVVTTLDMASGQVAELSSTAEGRATLPAGWSPDRSQIVFSTFGDKDMGVTGPIAPIKAAVFVVDADGQNLRQISPTTINAELGGWSPDGTRIVFTASEASGPDVYTVRPDGTDLRRLTTDGVSMAPTWTPDGRILFVRRLGGAGGAGASGLWVMDAGGANAAELVSGSANGDPGEFVGPPRWQPSGGPAIVPPPWHPSTATIIGPPPPTPLATPAPVLAPGFSWTGSLPAGASDPIDKTDTATPLNDGRVLITRNCERVAQLYDPLTGTFSPTGAMVTTRGGATATRLLDGRVLIAGGGFCGTSDTEAVQASAEIFDPQTATFSPTATMGAPRFRHTATLLLDGRVLITGGTTGAAPVAAAQVVFASYRVGSHKVGAGHAATGSDVLATAELYDPQTGTFSPTGSMSEFRDRHTATLLQDGRVLVAGGGGQYGIRASAELYDPASGTFAATGSMANGRTLHTATLLQDGRVLIAGGMRDNGVDYASAELYDPSSGKFRSTGSMGDNRQEHTATVLKDGRVLVAGGYSNDGPTYTILSSTDIFDPATGNFTALGSMGDARMDHVAALLNDGRVLIAGGTGIGTASLVDLNSAVLYQP